MTLGAVLLGRFSPAGERTRLSVVIFHRVRAVEDPLFSEEVDAARFAALVARLQQWFTILPLSEAVDRLQSRSLPPRALSITFDDGYADNRTVALPILERSGSGRHFSSQPGTSTVDGCSTTR